MVTVESFGLVVVSRGDDGWRYYGLGAGDTLLAGMDDVAEVGDMAQMKTKWAGESALAAGCVRDLE